MNTRHLDTKLKNHFKQYKQVLVLLGSRQVGKTTIVKRLFPNAKYLLVDNEPIKKILESYDIEAYKILLPSDVSQVIIDEIHLLSDPGRAVKIIYDQMPGIQIIITGSSSFHIKNKTSESLAGRKIDYFMYPLTFSEYISQKGFSDSELNYNLLNSITNGTNSSDDKVYTFDIAEVLETILIYGQYPHIIENTHDEKYLLNFVDSLIFKDILELQLIEDKKLARDLLRLLAFQIGNLINYSELADNLGADRRTIERYIEIFEQSFILFRLHPYSKNKRDELKKSPKIYFYDTGVRNALIDDFSLLNTRHDKGALFENFIISEILKQNTYTDAGYRMYYWRTKQGSEIDIVLEKHNKLIGIEVKYKHGAITKSFKNRYPDAQLQIITSNNFY